VKRREFITLLGGAAASWPLAARAQRAAKMLTIGYLGPATPAVESQRIAAFVQRLRELGWSEGRNLAIEYHWAEGRSERFSEIAPRLHIPRRQQPSHDIGGPRAATQVHARNRTYQRYFGRTPLAHLEPIR